MITSSYYAGELVTYCSTAKIVCEGSGASDENHVRLRYPGAAVAAENNDVVMFCMSATRPLGVARLLCALPALSYRHKACARRIAWRHATDTLMPANGSGVVVQHPITQQAAVPGLLGFRL